MYLRERMALARSRGVSCRIVCSDLFLSRLFSCNFLFRIFCSDLFLFFIIRKDDAASVEESLYGLIRRVELYDRVDGCDLFRTRKNDIFRYYFEL